jgi:hypothetical protein
MEKTKSNKKEENGIGYFIGPNGFQQLWIPFHHFSQFFRKYIMVGFYFLFYYRMRFDASPEITNENRE